MFILWQILQQACVAALHNIFCMLPQQTSSNTVDTNCNAVAKLCLHPKPLVSPVGQGNSWRHGGASVNGFAAESQPVLCSNQQLHSVNTNNNVEVCSRHFRPDDNHTCPSIESPSVTSAASTDNIRPLTEADATSSVCDAQEFISRPPVVSSEQDRQNEDETCDLPDDFSDMSIDIDDEDLDGAGLIYVCSPVEESKATDGTSGHYGKDPSHGVSVAEMVSVRNEG